MCDDGVESVVDALGVVVVGVRLEERVHALDGLGAQLGEEARDVLLVLSFLSLKNFGRLPLDGFKVLNRSSACGSMLVRSVLSLYHAAVSRARASDVAEGRIGRLDRARRRRPWPLRKKRKMRPS